MTEIVPGQLRQVKKNDPRITAQERGEIFFIVKTHDAMTTVLAGGKTREWSTTFIKKFSSVIS